MLKANSSLLFETPRMKVKNNTKDTVKHQQQHLQNLTFTDELGYNVWAVCLKPVCFCLRFQWWFSGEAFGLIAPFRRLLFIYLISYKHPSGHRHWWRTGKTLSIGTKKERERDLLRNGACNWLLQKILSMQTKNVQLGFETVYKGWAEVLKNPCLCLANIRGKSITSRCFPCGESQCCNYPHNGIMAEADVHVCLLFLLISI